MGPTICTQAIAVTSNVEGKLFELAILAAPAIYADRT